MQKSIGGFIAGLCALAGILIPSLSLASTLQEQITSTQQQIQVVQAQIAAGQQQLQTLQTQLTTLQDQLALQYPADIGPIKPVIAYGTSKLSSSYAGNALAVWKHNPDVQGIIGWSGDSLSTSSLNSFLAGAVGQVTTWYDQVGGNNAQQGFAEAPKISDQTIGGSPAIIFEGGSSSGTFNTPVGAIDSLSLPASISALNVAGNSYSVIAVVQPSVSLARNQAGALSPSKATLLDLQTQSSSAVTLFNDGSLSTIGWGASASDFSYTATDHFVETSPTVVAWISDTNGTRIWQNNTVSTSTLKSSVSLPVLSGFIGKKASSVAGPSADAFDGKIVALMIYKGALTDDERTKVFQALYTRFGINPQRNVNSVIFAGDSIAAGYKTLGVNGFEKRVQPLITNLARFGNFSMPGATITAQTSGVPPYAYVDGIFNSTIAPYMHTSGGKNILVLSGGGNDGLISPQPSASTVFNGILSVVSKARAAGVSDVLVCTILPRTGSYQPFIDSLNALIRADNGAHFRLCDLAADSRVGAYPPSATYFEDGVHPSAAGHQVIATILAPLIDAAINATSTPTPPPPPPPPALPSCTMSASPAVVTQGSAATLSWTMQNTQSSMLAIPATGQNIPYPGATGRSVTLNVTGTVGFVLYVADTAGHTGTCTASVTVQSAPTPPVSTSPSCTISAVSQGNGTVALSWTTQNARDLMLAIPQIGQNFPSPGATGKTITLGTTGHVDFLLYLANAQGATGVCSASLQLASSSTTYGDAMAAVVTAPFNLLVDALANVFLALRV